MARIELLPEVRAFPTALTGAFINGAAFAGGGDPIDVIDPASEEVIASIATATMETVDLAVRSADSAFRDARWRGMRPADRERILLRFADLVERDGERLAQLESWNQGKSIHIARAIDVGASVEYMRYVAGLTTKVTGLTLDLSIPMVPGQRYHAYTRPEPVGVVAAIAPWNFSLMIALWKIVPALAAGCTIVLKPSEITPLTAFRLAELAIDAGVPAGVFNVVHGRGARTGRALVDHDLVRKVSFTGSTATGKTIARAAVDRMARFSLELGGKNPALVLKDADLSRAVPGLVAAAFLNSGQVCAAASRIYVERPLHDDLVTALHDAIGGMKAGAGLDPDAQFTPLVSVDHRDKVLRHLALAEQAGATLLSGAAVPGRGWYVPPTLVIGAAADATIQHEEVFGPVLSVTPVDDIDRAVQQANATPYGLTASVWTNDLGRAMDLIPRIEAGTVYVNTHVPVDPNMPFGGYKQSGIGRDFGPDALDAYVERKSVCIAY